MAICAWQAAFLIAGWAPNGLRDARNQQTRMADMMKEDLQAITREVCRAAYREMQKRGISEVATAGALLQYSASGLARLGMERGDIHEIVDGVIDRTIAVSPILVPAGRA